MFFFSSRRRHTRLQGDWSSDVCSSDLGPAVAEISGDSLPEIIDSSGGYFVHAFNAAGVEPAGWPKLTGHWQTSTPSIGDINDRSEERRVGKEGRSRWSPDH